MGDGCGHLMGSDTSLRGVGTQGQPDRDSRTGSAVLAGSVAQVAPEDVSVAGGSPDCVGAGNC